MFKVQSSKIRYSAAVIICCSVIQLFSYSIFAQTPQKWSESYTFRNFGVREGLAQSQALFSFQDDYGYMWFTTLNGVSRFDGLQFDNFSMDDLRSVSFVKHIGMYETAVYLVTANNIVFIYPDRTMEFYPLPDNYSNVFHTDRFMPVIDEQLYLFNCLEQSRQSASYTILRFDLKHKTYTILDTGLPFLNPYISDQKLYAAPRAVKERQLPLYRMDHDTLRIVYRLDMEDDDHQIWFYLTNQNEWFGKLCKGRDVARQTYHLYRFFVENDIIRKEYIMQVNTALNCVERLDEHRLILTCSFANVLDLEDRSRTPFPLETHTIHFVSVDRDGALWFSTDDGVYHCTQNFTEYRLSGNDDIFSVIRDSRNNVWFTSYSNGFWRADEHGVLHQTDLVHQQNKISDYHGYASNCEDSRGRIYAIFDRGVAVHNPQKGDPNRLEVIQTGYSMAAFYDAIDDAVYFSGSTDKYFTLNVMHANGKITTYPFGVQNIASICRDGNQKIRIGTFANGEARLDEESQTVVFDTVPQPYKSVICMALDEHGTLWKGGTEGLFAEDRQGNDRQIIDQLTVFAVNYHNRYIIFGTEYTLHLLDLQAYYRDSVIQIRTFGFYDGFDVMSICQNGASIDRDGYVWLAGTDKAIRFQPDRLMKRPVLQPQPPHLTAVYNAGRDVDWLLVQDTASMQFENNSNYLRFDFLQASPSAPDKLMFRYRLNGYNDHWRITRERSVFFQNLSFGKYQLEIQSSFDDGQQWSESLYSQTIAIKPPFILSLPGLMLIFAGLVAIGLLIVYYTRKIIMRQEEEKRYIDRLRLNEVRSKFIPSFICNVLNSINYLIDDNPGKAQRYLSDFAEYSMNALFNADIPFRLLQDELDLTKLYLRLEKLRFEKRLEFDLSVEAEVNRQLEIPCMTIQTLCEIVIKHGLSTKPEGCKITVRIYQQNGFTVVSVEDNCIGCKKEQMINILGIEERLKIIQQQLDVFNKNKSKKAPRAYLQITDIHDADNQPSGTGFEVWIPH